MFKKIYIEVTNICNLNCLFCPGNNRDKEFMEINKFKYILNSLKGYTKYLYFHLMGEPLMHPEINKLIDLASDNYKINITTNGYYINRIENNNNIHQINISLHSFDEKNGKPLTEYLDEIFNAVDKLRVNNTIISYRLWTNNKYEKDIISALENKYKIKINGNTKIANGIFLEYSTEFIWPDINNNYCHQNGTCMGLRTHIGILVDGTVVPCCLDYNGKLKLGNIFEEDIKTIINSPRAKKMKIGFLNNQKVEEMCQHCNFYDRIKNN